MTAQIADQVEYRRLDHAIAGHNGTDLFEPADHGLKPVGSCTACWRGFVCCYRVADGALLLDKLCVSQRTPAPELFGIAPKKPESRPSFFDVVYERLAHPVPYTGGLLLGRDFIQELYVHMGFHPAWKFREVHELIFEKGMLTQASDRSQEIAGFRAEVSERALEPGHGASRREIERWVARCFSQQYRW
jgi:hypothetical protein